jgi:hypothetical protein
MIESVLGSGALLGAARRVSRVSNAACHAQTPPSFQTVELECVDEPADLGEPCERMRSKQPWSTSPRALGLDSDLRTDVRTARQENRAFGGDPCSVHCHPIKRVQRNIASSIL